MKPHPNHTTFSPPFGMLINGRGFTAAEYSFGFQGQEKDDDVKGVGNNIEFKYRLYDARLGRFLSSDPLEGSFPWNSPYAFAENKVIENMELEGAETINATTHLFRSGGSITILQMVNPGSQLQYVKTLVTAGMSTPGGTINTTNTRNLNNTPEHRIFGSKGGNEHTWNGSSRHNGFQSGALGGSFNYDLYRPILWGSSDGPILSSNVTTSSKTISGMTLYTRIPETRDVLKDLNLAASGLRALPSSVSTEMPPVVIRAPNIVTIPHPDIPGESIIFIQRILTNSTSSVQTQLNLEIKIHPDYIASLRATVESFAAKNPDISISYKTDDTITNPVEMTYSIQINTTVATTSTSKTTATDSSTGQNIPPRN